MTEKLKENKEKHGKKDCKGCGVVPGIGTKFCSAYKE
jgi:hypothetical protein